jgi:hypothetical protein
MYILEICENEPKVSLLILHFVLSDWKSIMWRIKIVLKNEFLYTLLRKVIWLYNSYGKGDIMSGLRSVQILFNTINFRILRSKRPRRILKIFR